MSILDRFLSPTPSFFKKIRNIGLVLVAVSGVILTAPVSLPAVVLQAATYVAVAGTVATTVSQVVTNEDDQPKAEPPTADKK